ncbi:MAG TPA: hypothetical protein VGW76_16110 [Pyrinomonadaceae bacterium]|nr:hypothetical protein [Pyrinomonadaceae bacterium]
MSTSLNDNLATPRSTLVEDGQAFYETHLKTALEPSHDGQFVAIEPSAARYFLGQTATAALVTARNAMPESQFFLTRVGRGFAHKT